MGIRGSYGMSYLKYHELSFCIVKHLSELISFYWKASKPDLLGGRCEEYVWWGRIYSLLIQRTRHTWNYIHILNKGYRNLLVHESRGGKMGRYRIFLLVRTHVTWIAPKWCYAGWMIEDLYCMFVTRLPMVPGGIRAYLDNICSSPSA